MARSHWRLLVVGSAVTALAVAIVVRGWPWQASDAERHAAALRSESFWVQDVPDVQVTHWSSLAEQPWVPWGRTCTVVGVHYRHGGAAASLLDRLSATATSTGWDVEPRNGRDRRLFTKRIEDERASLELHVDPAIDVVTAAMRLPPECE